MKVSSSNIKTFVDGNRFILVVENAMQDEVASLIREFVGKLQVDAPIKAIKALEPAPDPNLDNGPFIPEGQSGNELPPAPMSEEEINNYRFANGKYRGLTYNEALQKFGRRSSIDIYLLCKELPERIAPHIKGKCFQTIIHDLDSRDSTTDQRKTMQDFIFAYRPIANSIITEMKDDLGFSSVEDMVKFSDNDTLRNIYQTLIDNIRDAI